MMTTICALGTPGLALKPDWLRHILGLERRLRHPLSADQVHLGPRRRCDTLEGVPNVSRCQGRVSISAAGSILCAIRCRTLWKARIPWLVPGVVRHNENEDRNRDNGMHEPSKHARDEVEQHAEGGPDGPPRSFRVNIVSM